MIFRSNQLSITKAIRSLDSMDSGAARMRPALVLFLALMLASGVAYSDNGVIVAYPSGCDYFIADGPKGLYLLEWYGGYDPSKGDQIFGDLDSYGFKDVYYPNRDREGRIWVEDYLLSEDNAIEQYRDHCN